MDSGPRIVLDSPLPRKGLKRLRVVGRGLGSLKGSDSGVPSFFRFWESEEGPRLLLLERRDGGAGPRPPVQAPCSSIPAVGRSGADIEPHHICPTVCRARPEQILLNGTRDPLPRRTELARRGPAPGGGPLEERRAAEAPRPLGAEGAGSAPQDSTRVLVGPGASDSWLVLATGAEAGQARRAGSGRLAPAGPRRWRGPL